MSHTTWLAATALLAALVGCTDQPTPTAPPPGSQSIQSSGTPADQQAMMERLARRFAQALNNPGFRSRVHASLEQSHFPEHKVYFQGYLTESNRRVLREIAQLSGANAAEIEADAANAVGLELYLPVPEHRARWAGANFTLDPNAVRAASVFRER